MIEIDGTALHQWDVGRRVVVTGIEVEYVHFANKGDTKAVIMGVVDTHAKIPDFLLQTGKQLCVYAVKDGITVGTRTFYVQKRERPENYVYEDDQRNYIEKTFIKTINGKTPDENGNVEIEVSCGSGGGLTTNAITLLTDVLRHALYLGDYDSEATITALTAELAKTGGGSSGGDSGGDSSGDVSVFTITYNLTNTVCSVKTPTIAAGSVFSASLSADENYNLSTVAVTMGGEDVTENVYDNGIISIGAVIGNIVIDAVSQPNTMILVNGSGTSNMTYTSRTVDWVVTNNKTVELSNFTFAPNQEGIAILDAPQASASSIGRGYSSNTTKFSLKTGDVIAVAVTFDSISWSPSYVKPVLYTTVGSIDMPKYMNDGTGTVANMVGKTYTSTYTADAEYDVTELFMWFRVFGDTSNVANSHTKFTLSVKINDVEVLGV